MGRIKSKLIKRTAITLVDRKDIEFSQGFDENKRILDNVTPSKKLRNKVAGYITRLERRDQK